MTPSLPAFPSLAPARRAALRHRLLSWYRRERRDLPWRRRRDPYAVWVAETMLQQTRVAAVIPYFERFVREFPDPASLAQAPEERVLAAWSGLGYYSRARNLLRAAGLVVERHGGQVPSDPEALAALPGVGRYTLGAVLSIAFDRPWPVVDGNVARVLSRLFALRGDGARGGARTGLWRIAQDLVAGAAPGDFNQALMELGATVCLPRGPRCGACPLRALCRACGEGRPEAYPAPRRRPAPRRVEVVAAVVESARGVWLERRAAGPNRGLYDLPAVEADGAGGAPAAGRLARRLAARGIRVLGWAPAGRFRHAIMGDAYTVTLLRGRTLASASRDAGARAAPAPAAGTWVARTRLSQFPLTARARRALALAPAGGE